MKLDTDPFLVGMVELELKKILVRTDQVETTKVKNVIVVDDLRNRMIKPINQWLELIEKYKCQQEEDRRYRVT
jgi:hypothetical protein